MKTMKPNPAFLATLGVFAILTGGALGQISDSDVEAAIRDEINKANGAISVSDLAKVKNLNLAGLEKAGVTLPEGLVNLEVLDLSGNRLKPSIFSPTKLPDDLEKLTEIDLSGNILPNINLIASIPSLEIVRVNSNSFTSLSVPGELINLKEIYLSNNGLTEITFEEGLDSLTFVDLSKNDLTDLDGLANLPAIEILDASDNDFKKLTMPEIFSLKELNLNTSMLTSFVIGEGFLNLEVITIAKNDLAGSVFTGPVSFANDLINLRVLDLRDNELSSFTVPAGLVSLEILRLEKNTLSKLEFDGPLPNVIEIIAFENRLKKLTLPEGMAKLELLELFENELTEITIQRGFPTDPEPNIDLFDNDDLAKITLPEGAPEDLIFVFSRLLDDPDNQIFFIPLPLPDVSPSLSETGDFELTVSGPLGTYTVFRTTDFSAWASVGSVVNETGMVTYTQAVGGNPLGMFRVERAPDPEE
jgi:Leucine-rich repeat (LRR) protein